MANTEIMTLNMGPQHPSTHGVLRLELVMDGEVVVDVIPHIGYLHRCFEKHCEHMTNYQQVIPYADRMDYVAAMSSEFGYVVAAEKLMPGAEVDLCRGSIERGLGVGRAGGARIGICAPCPSSR